MRRPFAYVSAAARSKGSSPSKGRPCSAQYARSAPSPSALPAWRPVHDHGHGLADLPESLMRQPEIVEPERRRLGHQQDGVGVEPNGHSGTAYAGGRIDERVGGDRREHQIQFFTQGAQDRRGHGFPDAGAPHEEAAPAFRTAP